MLHLPRRTISTLVLAANVLLPTIAVAQPDDCWPTGTCERQPTPVATSAQSTAAASEQASPVPASELGKVTLYAHFGFGTPYGVLGATLDVAATRWLVLAAGLGINPDEGAEAGITPRLRLKLFEDSYATLGSGVSWAHRYVGHADPVGELIAEHRVALPTWSPAYFWNSELGFETRYRHFAFRLYAGYARVINASSYTCSEGQGCDPQGAAGLVYFGTALGYAF